MIDESRGKSAYAVLAASTRISAVEICSKKKTGPPPKTCSAIWAITVCSSLGYGCS